MSMRSS